MVPSVSLTYTYCGNKNVDSFFKHKNTCPLRHVSFFSWDPEQAGQLIMYYTPKKVLPFAFF